MFLDIFWVKLMITSEEWKFGQDLVGTGLGAILGPLSPYVPAPLSINHDFDTSSEHSIAGQYRLLSIICLVCMLSHSRVMNVTVSSK